METQDSRPKNTDEIDLSQLFRWIGRGFRNFGNSIIFGIAGLRNLFFNNRTFFLGLIAFGLILGAIYSELIKKEYYKSTMIFSCDYLNNRILESTIDKFNLLCEERDREGLIRELGLDSATAINIRKFESAPFVSENDVVEMEVLREQLNNVVAEKKEIVSKVIDKLTIENKNAYSISVYVYDPDVVGKLQEAIVRYFKSSEYLTKRLAMNEENLKARREKLIAESKKLDSLKRVIFDNYQNIGKTSRGSGNVYLGDEKLADPLAVFEKDLSINQEILEINRELKVRPDFEVVDPFTTIKLPDNAGLAEILFISFWISFLMGYVIIGIYRFDKLLASYQTRA